MRLAGHHGADSLKKGFGNGLPRETPQMYSPGMLPLPEAVDSIADETGFAGVVAVDRRDEIEFAKAYGYAHHAYKIPNTVDTRFAIASGSKGLTALTVPSAVESLVTPNLLSGREEVR